MYIHDKPGPLVLVPTPADPQELAVHAVKSARTHQLEHELLAAMRRLALAEMTARRSLTRFDEVVRHNAALRRGAALEAFAHSLARDVDMTLLPFRQEEPWVDPAGGVS